MLLTDGNGNRNDKQYSRMVIAGVSISSASHKSLYGSKNGSEMMKRCCSNCSHTAATPNLAAKYSSGPCLLDLVLSNIKYFRMTALLMGAFNEMNKILPNKTTLIYSKENTYNKAKPILKSLSDGEKPRTYTGCGS